MNKCQSVWEKQTENTLQELKPDFMAIRLWEIFTFSDETVLVKPSVVPQRPCTVAG